MSHEQDVEHEIEYYYAEPLNRNATGFYFSNYEDYENKAQALRDCFGNVGEEFDIQIVDVEREMSELFEACDVRQTNLEDWFNDVADLSDHEKVQLYFLVRMQGYHFNSALGKVRDVSIFEGALQEAAIELFNKIYLNSIPENLQFYINYELFANDCEKSGDMSEFEFAGKTYTCTNSGSL